VPVRLHFSFVLLISFVVVNGLGSNQSPAFYIVYILALFASVVMHELSHSLVGSGYGIKTVEIVMFPTGGVSRLARSPKPSEEIWIALAGPLTNGLMAAVLMGVLAWQGAGTNLFELVEPTDANLVQRIAFANLVLAGFNLLPAFPMDGGRVLRSVLARLKGEEAATRAAAWSGRILALSMGLYGLLTLQFPLVFVAFFVYLGAAQEGAASMGRTLTRGIPVRAAMMTAYHTLSHGSTVRDATNLLLATAQQDFPIVHGEQVIGLLGRSALLRTMAREGPDAYVAAAMDREFPKLSPDMDLAEVLPLMAPTGACALIMQGEQLLGLITSENLSQYLLLRRFGMQASQIRT
jgi:Zn-dependent protease/CBS domain-containing protein